MLSPSLSSSALNIAQYIVRYTRRANNNLALRSGSVPILFRGVTFYSSSVLLAFSMSTIPYATYQPDARPSQRQRKPMEYCVTLRHMCHANHCPPFVLIACTWLLSSEFSVLNFSITSDMEFICSSAPALNSSMILNTRHNRKTITIDPTSSKTPFKQTSIKKPAMMTAASKQWNHDLK